MANESDAEIVVSSLREALHAAAADDLVIHAAWADSPTSACVVYQSPLTDGLTGRRITFPPHAHDDDPVSTGQDWAQTIMEPLGRTPRSHRRDAHGVSWINVSGDFPVPPSLG